MRRGGCLLAGCFRLPELWPAYGILHPCNKTQSLILFPEGLGAYRVIGNMRWHHGKLSAREGGCYCDLLRQIEVALQ